MRSAFSLVELLVVVAVVSVLVGVVLPALSGVRAAARTAACLSNVRQLAIAQSIYMGDCDGALVDAGMPHGGLDLERFDTLWITALAPYYANPGVVRSPVDTSPFWSLEEGGEDPGMTLPRFLGFFGSNRGLFLDGDPGNDPAVVRARWNSYGLNNLVCASFSPLRGGYDDPVSGRQIPGPVTPYARIDRIPGPARTVQWLMMVREDPVAAPAGGYAKSDHVHVEDWAPGALPIPTEIFAPAKASEQMDTGAHGGEPGTLGARSNYGFLDGHAETLGFGSVYRDPFVNRFHPEASVP